jgi:hypothetical protein
VVKGHFPLLKATVYASVVCTVALNKEGIRLEVRLKKRIEGDLAHWLFIIFCPYRFVHDSMSSEIEERGSILPVLPVF